MQLFPEFTTVVHVCYTRHVKNAVEFTVTLIRPPYKGDIDTITYCTCTKATKAFASAFAAAGRRCGVHACLVKPALSCERAFLPKARHGGQPPPPPRYPRRNRERT